MRYLYEKTAIYKNVRVLCGSVKSTFYLFKIPRVRIYFTRIRLVTAHVTLTYATFSNRRTARLRKKRASYNDRLALSSRSYSVEKSMKNRIFAGKINKKDWNLGGEVMWTWEKSTFWKRYKGFYILRNAEMISLLI